MLGLEEARAQAAEIELLKSMFKLGTELNVDEISDAELRAYAEGTSGSPPASRAQLSIKLKTENPPVSIALECSYSAEYPKELPSITVRCVELTRSQQTQLHSDLNGFLREHCRGDVCVLSAVQWLSKHASEYITKSIRVSSLGKEPDSIQADDAFARLWIYSHHIYNKIKRKNILEWSKELNLCGFSMPGKPGVVCVEGLRSACDEFWARVRVLTWKRILIRHREEAPLDSPCTEETMCSLRKFSGFQETAFEPHGSRGNHMDLGQLYQFLSDKGCADIFQMYFGIEGR